MIYLDSAATAPVRREALEAAWPYLTGTFGNPSSHHPVGESAAAGLEDARARAAAVLGARRSDIVFTAGGTEAANLALKGLALASPRGKHLVTAATEHEAVLESIDFLHRVHGFDVDLVEVASDGGVSAEALRAVLREDTTLVSLALANNEIGTVHDIRELAEVARSAGALMHTDAVQAAGHLGLRGLGVDALTLSGHKLGAPKGTGLAMIRGRHPLEPLVHGGGQESGRRSGTENVAFAVALAVALELAESERLDAAARLGAMRDLLVRRVLAAREGVLLTGPDIDRPGARLPGHASFCVPGRSGESIVLDLAERGVISSSGSACAAGSDEPSHVLVALGIPREIAQTAVRFTLGRGITASEVEQAATVIGEVLAPTRSS